MQTPLVSIIVPIYKVEPYLRRCLDSIVNQTYTNLEIILVDDGSPDGCPQICDEYAAKDKRIVVIHKENGGLSDARNAGLDICKGEYIFFIDSDDWIKTDTIEFLYKITQDKKSDIVIGDYITTTETGYHQKQSTSKHIIEMSLFNLLKCHQPGHPLFTQVVAAWNKLIKRDIAKKWSFPKGAICEDHYTTYKYFFSASKVILTNKKTYYYRTREGSIVNNLAKDPIRDNYIQFEYLRERISFFLDQARIDIANLFIDQYTRNAIYLYIIESKNKRNKSIHIQDILAFKKYLKTKCVRFSVNHLNICIKFYSILCKFSTEKIARNIILGEKGSLIAFIWKALKLPDTQFRKKLFFPK